MKLKSSIEEILKISERVISKKKFKDENDFKNLAQKVFNSFYSNLVKVRINKLKFNITKSKLRYQNWEIEFEVRFSLNDPYIDNKVYENGTVHIFPSETFYKDIEKTCLKNFEVLPIWNENKNIATLTGKARDY